MTAPLIICDTCGRQRNCLRHHRAAFPPDAARNWMQRHCPQPPGQRHCRLRYQAGIEVVFPDEEPVDTPPSPA